MHQITGGRKAKYIFSKEEWHGQNRKRRPENRGKLEQGASMVMTSWRPAGNACQWISLPRNAYFAFCMGLGSAVKMRSPPTPKLDSTRSQKNCKEEGGSIERPIIRWCKVEVAENCAPIWWRQQRKRSVWKRALWLSSLVVPSNWHSEVLWFWTCIFHLDIIANIFLFDIFTMNLID